MTPIYEYIYTWLLYLLCPSASLLSPELDLLHKRLRSGSQKTDPSAEPNQSLIWPSAQTSAKKFRTMAMVSIFSTGKASGIPTKADNATVFINWRLHATYSIYRKSQHSKMHFSYMKQTFQFMKYNCIAQIQQKRNQKHKMYIGNSVFHFLLHRHNNFFKLSIFNL